MKNGKWWEAVVDRPGPAAGGGAQGLRRPHLARAGAIALLALAGCSATKQLNTDKAEDLIRTQLQGKVDARIEGVSCAERKVKQGDVSECTAQVDGQRLRLQITQDDNQGSVRIIPVQAIIEVQQAVTLIEEQVGKAKRLPVATNCGTQRYLVKDPGATFDCAVMTKSGRPSGKVVVTVKDVEGNVDMRLV